MRRAGAAGAFLPVLVLLAGCGGQPGTAAEPTPSSTQPVAPADYAVLKHFTPEDSLAEYGLSPVTEPPEPELVTGPDFVLAVRETAVAGTLDAGQRQALFLPGPQGSDDEAGPLLAGPGREFLVAWVGKPEDAPPAGRTVQLNASVQAEDQRSVGLDRFTRGAVIVVSVPTGGDAILGLYHAEAARSLSLRTGRDVSGGGSPADGLAGARVELADYFRIDGITPAEVVDGVQCRLRMDPTSHVREEGAAADGRMWLEVTVELSAGAGSWHASEHATVEVDLAESLTIVGDGGDPLPVPPGTVTLDTSDHPGLLAGETSLRFEVPDTLRTFEVTFRLNATLTAKDGSGVLGYQRHEGGENTGTLTLAPID